MKSSALGYLLVCCCLLVAPTISAQDSNIRWKRTNCDFWPNACYFDHRGYSEADALTLESRWDLIGAANGDSSDEWAGDYTISNEFRFIVLRWSPQSGFAAVSIYTCLGQILRLSYGRVTASSNLIQLSPEFSSLPLGKTPYVNYLPAAKYLPVKWGERHYLIPKDEIKDFCDYVAGLGRYAEYERIADDELDAHYLLKSSDYEKPKAGLPILPSGYERFVRKPIDAVITAVKRSRVKPIHGDTEFEDLITPVTLSAGSAQGVKPGMKFRLLSSEELETVKIVRVTRDRAQGIIVKYVRKGSEAESNGQGNNEPPITVGWKVSTSPHKK